MKKQNYRRILIVLLFCNIAGAGIVYFEHCRNSLPDNILLTMGKAAKLQYSVPAIGEIQKKTVQMNQPFELKKNSYGELHMNARLFGTIPLKNITVRVVREKRLAPSGKIVGIYVETKGMLVLETDTFTGENGVGYAPSSGKLFKGDYILTVNNQKVKTKSQLIHMINQWGRHNLYLRVKRSGKVVNLRVKPALAASDHQYKIGAWVRDNTQGIGTLTYTSADQFGGLGHSICDMDTGKQMNIQGGYLLTPIVHSITKGKSGTPGEIVGSISYDDENLLGEIKKNTKYGIYGTLYQSAYADSCPIGYKQDVKTGEASVISCISGQRRTYRIRILKADQSNYNRMKGMEIQIVDPRLLKLTNGIVQGMSGSPILQNGKVIGAVTHVFVDDSTKGYGTFIENMLNSSY